ncbi:hypothetical protein OHB53_14635 [Streptomyces sp. NBC_00056]|uniref:hypothetical protein n=1 Tax=unclassified Streptomyces TaxID=2593676 RepID=UPI0022598572|nr:MULTISPECIES: hypothetical protein [unclassified Streptomyces]MCX5440322.1 hypothetical protein [Streptomyces sp. NBC_00063]WUB93278.1 hypothetical protein OHO83_13775 [Streptomyces sp. NBC_00569]
MSDSEAPGGSPDFLDRLLARHTAPRPAAARVRPRLPGPFERVEAVRAAAPAPDDDTLLWPAAAPPAVPPPDAPAPTAVAARTHTERERTVVHTERAAEPQGPRPAAPARAEAPSPRPAATVARALRPPPDSGRRAAVRAEREPAQTAVSVPVPPGRDVAPHAVSAALPPSAADTAATREAVRQAAARRPARATEQVVQVQIGRLEVTAGEAPGAGRPRTPAAGRTGATLSLAEYLARGRE